MTTKEALSRAMSACAGVANRTRGLIAVSKALPADEFYRLARQHPDTLSRDLDNADADFARAKSEYEKHCAAIGAPAYATWNED